MLSASHRSFHHHRWKVLASSLQQSFPSIRVASCHYDDSVYVTKRSSATLWHSSRSHRAFARRNCPVSPHAQSVHWILKWKPKELAGVNAFVMPGNRFRFGYQFRISHRSPFQPSVSIQSSVSIQPSVSDQPSTYTQPSVSDQASVSIQFRIRLRFRFSHQFRIRLRFHHETHAKAFLKMLRLSVLPQDNVPMCDIQLSIAKSLSAGK